MEINKGKEGPKNKRDKWKHGKETKESEAGKWKERNGH